MSIRSYCITEDHWAQALQVVLTEEAEEAVSTAKQHLNKGRLTEAWNVTDTSLGNTLCTGDTRTELYLIRAEIRARINKPDQSLNEAVLGLQSIKLPSPLCAKLINHAVFAARQLQENEAIPKVFSQLNKLNGRNQLCAQMLYQIAKSFFYQCRCIEASQIAMRGLQFFPCNELQNIVDRCAENVDSPQNNKRKGRFD